MSTTDIGSISSGTLRTEDLLEAFADELERINHQVSAVPEKLESAAVIAEARKLLDKRADDWTDEDQEAASWVVNEDLMDALSEYAPPCCYFGAHPGDRADFGFWVSDDALRDGIHDGEILAVSDDRNAERSTVPEYVLHTNDHGNMTLYRIHLDEVWSIV